MIPAITTISIVVIIGVILWSLMQAYNHNPPAHFVRVWGQLVLYYLAPTMPWWALLVVMLTINSVLSIFISATLLAIIVLYFYSAYYIPRQITVNYASYHNSPATNETSQPLNIAVIANLRLGLFSHPNQFVKLVDRLNQLNVEAVIIVGEWLYNPPADLVGNLMLLKGINKPIYAIQGEHDHRYYPENADQFLHEDDLNHVFESLGITEVIGTTPTNFGVSLIAKIIRDQSGFDQAIANQAIESQPHILLTNTVNGIKPYLAIQDTSSQVEASDASNNNKVEADLNLSTLKSSLLLLIAPDESVVSKAYYKAYKTTQNKLTAKWVKVIQIIPSFGQRGAPFRLSKPSITVININDK